MVNLCKVIFFKTRSEFTVILPGMEGHENDSINSITGDKKKKESMKMKTN